MKHCALWGGSRFNPGELTVTDSPLRPTETEQNTNVHRRQRERGGDKQDEGSGEGERANKCEKRKSFKAERAMEGRNEVNVKGSWRCEA